MIKEWASLFNTYHMMPCMYFSGVDSSDITIDGNSNEYITVDPELYGRVRNIMEKCKIFFDYSLIKDS